ncbi:SET domain-containing protein-lysine N-methyltransferase [bacterium]|nr:SET domain-containing protein-lysine N-methyltransferase [bacterium]
MPIATRGEYWFVKQSKVHGRGLFARTDIPKGATIIEYTGKRMPPDALPDIDEDDPDAHHTVIFTLEDGWLLDAAQGGNAAQFANHSCHPNCETFEENGRIFIRALRKISKGTELVYDYHLHLSGRFKKRWLVDYACYCAARNCRRILLNRKIPSKYIHLI